VTVFLAGAFGQGNPGDEALLTAFLRALGHLKPVVSTCDPAGTASTHGVSVVERDDVARVGREIARADAVVVAGGTIFKTLHPSCGRPPLSLLRRTAALAAFTRALRKPLALIGVGAVPLRGRTAGRLARSIVRAADLLILRDDESAAHLAAAGAPTPLRVGADAAWTLVPARSPAAVALRLTGVATPRANGSPGPETGPERPVVVALSHLAGGPDLAARLAAGLHPVLAAGLPVRLDPWQPDGDAELATEVAARLAGPHVAVGAPPDAANAGATVGTPPARLGEALRGMAGARLVVAQRMHALVAAAGAGVPALAVAHEPKLAGLARRLEQPAVAPDGPPDAFGSAVLRALDGAPAAAAVIERERARAEDAFRLLRVLLARGRTDEAVDIEGLPLRPEEWLG
jgi:polysaccharide pyruvyl transferase WcaK-like protein